MPTPPSLMPVRAGFIPLIDCAALVVAREKGFATRHGIDLQLHREGSWAAIRDKVAFGALECAHMLAGMTLALELGVQGVRMNMSAPLALGQGGNAITLAPWLVAAMGLADPEAMAAPRPGRNRALARVVAARREQGDPPLKLAMVYPFSSHNYELRLWLAEAGIDPDRDVELVVVPPPRMVASLAKREISGFCVGEPWNQLAVAQGLGEIVVTKHDLCPTAPEKVLGMREVWRAAHADTVTRLLMALMEAGRWADQLENLPELTHLLAAPHYVGVEAGLIAAVLSGHPRIAPGRELALPDYQYFHRHQAQSPRISQGEWLMVQMARWGQVGPEQGVMDAATRVFRPDLYREAALALKNAPDVPGSTLE